MLDFLEMRIQFRGEITSIVQFLRYAFQYLLRFLRFSFRGCEQLLGLCHPLQRFGHHVLGLLEGLCFDRKLCRCFLQGFLGLLEGQLGLSLLAV